MQRSSTPHNRAEAFKFWATPLARPWRMLRQMASFTKVGLQAGMVVLAMVFLLIIPSIFVHSVAPSRRVGYFGPFWRVFTKIILRIGVGAKVQCFDRRGQFHNPLGRGLYVSNHLSMIDIPLIAEHHTVLPLMKKEVAEIPMFGKIIQAVGPITVDRRDNGSRQRAFNECKRRLKNNWAVQYYPEGTRSKDGIPKDFSEIHSRLIETAYDLGVAVTPISIYGTANILGPNGDIRTGEKAAMITHEEMWPKDFDSADQFARAVWETVVNGFYELEKM